MLEVDDGYITVTEQKLIVVHDLPAADAGEDQSIPFGTSTQLHGSVEGVQENYEVEWQPEDFLESSTVWEPYTLQLENTKEFHMTLEETTTGCTASDAVIVTVTGGALEVTISAGEEYVCYGDQIQLNAYGSGGSGDYTYSWSSVPEGFSSNLQNPVVSPQQPTTYRLVLNDGFNTAEQSVTIDVKENPSLQVMNDTSIIYGEALQLHSWPDGGAPPYQFSWNPAAYLQHQNVADPMTTELFSNTTFTVFVEDEWGCKSETREIALNIETNTLSVNVNPGSPEICLGDSILLRGSFSGNIGTAATHWSDAMGNMLSEQDEMVVHPATSTDYYYVAHDDYFSDSVLCRVVVYPNPEIGIYAENYIVEENYLSLCVYDTVLLQASEALYDFTWSNGATTPEIIIGTSGISVDMQELSVVAVNEFGCVSRDSVLAVFSYNACVGLVEITQPKMQIFPNPVSGVLKIVHPFGDNQKPITLKVTTLKGETMTEKPLRNKEYWLDVHGWSKGSYIVSLSAQGFTISEQFVVR